MKPRNSDREKQLDILLPTSIFYNRKLSFLESIVVYIIETHKLSFSRVAKLTNRDPRNIHTIYTRATKKLGTQLLKIPTKNQIFIPLSIVKDRSLSILEVVVYHLKQNTPLTNNQISILLNRSPKTIWTVYSRAKKKNE